MKFVTKENEKVITDFQKHTLRKTNKRMVSLLLVIFCLSVFLLILGEYVSGSALMIFSIIFLLVYFPSVKIANKKINSTNPLMMSEKIVEMEFKETKFSYTTYKDNEMINFSVVEYKDLYMVDEVSDYFFIFLGMNIGLCVVKEDLDKNEIDELRGILQSNCSKYNKIDRR